MDVQSEKPLNCLRCKTVELIALDSPGNISFFECPNCHRNYARKKGKGLTFRWLHPISLFLYPVIFKANPMQFFEQIAPSFKATTPTTPEAVERIRFTVREITLELEDPTQQVRDILGCCASEEDLRKYLRCVADLLMKQLDIPK